MKLIEQHFLLFQKCLKLAADGAPDAGVQKLWGVFWDKFYSSYKVKENKYYQIHSDGSFTETKRARPIPVSKISKSDQK